MIDNRYTKMQKSQYKNGTSNHEEHNENPDIGILDTTKNVAKRKVTNTVKNLFGKLPESINSGISKKPVSRPRKRKRVGGSKKLSKKFKKHNI